MGVEAIEMSLSKSPSQSERDDESAADYPTFERMERVLDEKGELMVKTAAGDELELHKHNVSFEEAPWMQIDGDDEVHWLDAEKIERYWIHEEI